MSLEQQTPAPYPTLSRNHLLAMDNSFSRDVGGCHTISASAVYSNLQNNGIHPGQPEYSDDSSSKEEEDNDPEEAELSSNFSEVQNYAVPGAEPAQARVSEQEQQIFLQPETCPTTEQLVNEVCKIYSGLVIVEKKCIKMDKQHTESPNKPSDHEWQTLISLHQTLLHKHHKFFLASQHPSASLALKRSPEKNNMPARMWRHGIHSFLDLLHHQLPEYAKIYARVLAFSFFDDDPIPEKRSRVLRYLDRVSR